MDFLFNRKPNRYTSTSHNTYKRCHKYFITGKAQTSLEKTLALWFKFETQKHFMCLPVSGGSNKDDVIRSVYFFYDKIS